MKGRGSILGVAVALAASCGSDKPAKPSALPVQGKVTIDGAPRRVVACAARPDGERVKIDITLEGSSVLTWWSDEPTLAWGDGLTRTPVECSATSHDLEAGAVDRIVAWVAGRVRYTCTLDEGPLEVDLTLACGPRPK